MAGPGDPLRADAGFFEHGREALAALAAYLGARLRLAGIETKEALVHLAILIGLVVVTLGVVALGYLFLCIGLVMLVARVLHVHPEWVMIVFALLHFGGGLACVLIAKARLGTALFSATLEEFKKDQQWLTTSKQN